MGRLRDAAAAARALVRGVREDHATILHYDAKYGDGRSRAGSLPRDAVQKIGFQMMAAVRVMRFLKQARVPLAPKVMSRAIRHLYGSDVHWDAELDDGVMLVHGFGLAISHSAKVRRGAILFQNVTLGMGTHPDTREYGAPTIEENVHVGAGAQILGPVTIGAGSKIMGNCIVTRSVPPDSIVEAPEAIARPRKRGGAAHDVTKRPRGEQR